MLAAFSVTPLGAGDSVGDAVADAVRIVRASGLPNETNAMFTNVEGEWDDIQRLLGEVIEATAAHAPRVSVVVKLDHRRDDPGGRLRSKVERVESRLGGEATVREGGDSGGSG